MTSSTMKALVLTTANRTASVKTIPVPVPKSNELLVAVRAIALNPVDAYWVAAPIAGQEERVVGLDFAGEVVQVPESLLLDGKRPTDPRLERGARVSGFMQGACSTTARPGCFAELITPEHDLVWRIPDSMSYEEAATISTCGMTAAHSIFFHLGLPSPFWEQPSSLSSNGPPLTVFLYGASTSVGLFAAQMVQMAAKSSKHNIKLFGAASRAKHALLKGEPYKFDELVDYHDVDWPEKVRALANGDGVDFALDCISEGKTVLDTQSVLNDKAGKLVVVRGTPSGGGYEADERGIKPIYEIVFTALGHELDMKGYHLPKDPVAREFAVRFFDYLTRGSLQGQIVVYPNPVRRMPGGLDRVVPDGFALLSSGVMASSFNEEGEAHERRTEEYMKPISGEKLVYTLK